MTPQEIQKVAALIEQRLGVPTLANAETLTALTDAMNTVGQPDIKPGEIAYLVNELFKRFAADNG